MKEMKPPRSQYLVWVVDVWVWHVTVDVISGGSARDGNGGNVRGSISDEEYVPSEAESEDYYSG